MKELKVSLPISRLHGGREEGEDGGRKEKEKHHKKHKKHKDKKRHEHEASGKTLSRVDLAAKPSVGVLEGERAGHGEREGERKSYGGKGLGYRAPVEVGTGGRGSVQSHRAERPQLGQKEHPLSLSYTSHHPPPSLTPHPPPSPPPPTSPTDPSLLETKFSDKYYQHKRRMMEKDSAIPHSLSHTSPAIETTPSHSHSFTTSLAAPPEQHKHHKKKKKKKHSKSHTTDPPSTDAGRKVSVRLPQSEERVLTPPTSDISSVSLERELVELRPLSPLSVPTVPVEREERKREEEKERGWLAAKRMKLSTVADTSSPTFAPSSPPSVPTPVATPSSDKSGWGITDEATPPKRRRNLAHSTARSGVGKQLWMLGVESGEEEEEDEEEEEEEDKRGGEEEGRVLADYDPPPMALEQLQPQPAHQPQGMNIVN